MVFKITCVGSTPAILDTLNFKTTIEETPYKISNLTKKNNFIWLKNAIRYQLVKNYNFLKNCKKRLKPTHISGTCNLKNLSLLINFSSFKLGRSRLNPPKFASSSKNTNLNALCTKNTPNYDISNSRESFSKLFLNYTKFKHSKYLRNVKTRQYSRAVALITFKKSNIKCRDVTVNYMYNYFSVYPLVALYLNHTANSNVKLLHILLTNLNTFKMGNTYTLYKNSYQITDVDLNFVFSKNISHHPIRTNTFFLNYTGNFTNPQNSILSSTAFNDDAPAESLSVIWSDLQNALFHTKSKNSSAQASFMSINFLNQEYFIKSDSFFTELDFQNFNRNGLPYNLSSVNHKVSTSKTHFLLTYSHGFSLLNLLYPLRLKSKTFYSNYVHSFINTYDKNFNDIYNYKSLSSYNFRLRTLISSPKYFKKFNKLITFNFKNQIVKLPRKIFKHHTPTYSVARILKETTNLKLNNIKNSMFKLGNFIKEYDFDLDDSFATFINLDKKRQSLITQIPNNDYEDFNKETSYLSGIEYPSTPKRNVDISHTGSDNYSFIKNSMLNSYKLPKIFSYYNILNILNILTNPFLLKILLNDSGFELKLNSSINSRAVCVLTSILNLFCKFNTRSNTLVTNNHSNLTNLIPNYHFKLSIFKKVSGSFGESIFSLSNIPWHYNTVIRFFEFCSGRKILFQFYPFLFQSIEKYYVALYKRWMPRMSYYERNMGRRFFLEEALHLIHLSLNLHDPKIMLLWMKAIIGRISFWKTRSIFRFLKYLFRQYFHTILHEIGAKGLKICLRGKISAAGNSRTRTILYRFGKNSHANTSLKVLNEFTTIGTFTGVLGFQLWIFY